MSSDDSSDDEMMQKLREATDNSFLNDTMFQDSDTKNKDKSNKVIEKKKSQRYLETNNKDNELNISDGMKNFVSRKLAKLIDEQICFVEMVTPEITNLNKPEIDEEIGIKLFSDSDSYLKISNEDENYKEIYKNQMEKRKAIKRRNEDEMTEAEKCKAASIDTEYMLSGEETKHWIKEHRNKEYKYKLIKNKLHFIEPVNEFTKCRKKNNWDESKISRKSHK